MEITAQITSQSLLSLISDEDKQSIEDLGIIDSISIDSGYFGIEKDSGYFGVCIENVGDDNVYIENLLPAVIGKSKKIVPGDVFSLDIISANNFHIISENVTVKLIIIIT